MYLLYTVHSFSQYFRYTYFIVLHIQICIIAGISFNLMCSDEILYPFYLLLLFIRTLNLGHELLWSLSSVLCQPNPETHYLSLALVRCASLLLFRTEKAILFVGQFLEVGIFISESGRLKINSQLMFVGGLREVLNTCNFFCTVYISHFSSF